MVTASNRQVSAIQKAISQIQPHTGKTPPATIKALLKALKTPDRQNTTHQQAPVNGKLPVKNAGLVIIAPFLPALFQVLDIADKKSITDPGKALAVLQEIEWGKLGKHGADLALPKILCGLPLTNALQPDRRISPKEKRETEAMLQEVISHWKALKNTSPDGLRTNYFWREGLLAENDSGYTLQVENKAQDLLLAHLPWGIGIIKLPWMKRPLHVEWI